ncbi:MAG: hypothetical protein PVG41_16560, partial [Desulfobacteraceae bacterium]
KSTPAARYRPGAPECFICSRIKIFSKLFGEKGRLIGTSRWMRTLSAHIEPQGFVISVPYQWRETVSPPSTDNDERKFYVLLNN